MKRHLLLVAMLASPLALAVGTGTHYPDDPHNPAPQPGVDSTLNPVEKPMPRNTAPFISDSEAEVRTEKHHDDRDLPGMDSSGYDTPGHQAPKPGSSGVGSP